MWQRLRALAKTVKFKILLALLGFCLVFLSVFSFFYLHATQALTERILASYDDMLSMYVGQLETQILDMENYLHNLSTDFDVNTLAIRSPGTDEYVLAKFRIFIKTLKSHSTYNLLDGVYFYDRRNASLLMIPNDLKRYESVAHAAVEQGGNRWQLHAQDSAYVLAKQKQVSDSLAVVFFIRVEDLVQTMKDITDGGGYALVVSSAAGEQVYGAVEPSADTGYRRIEKALDLTGLRFQLLVRNDSIQAELSFYTFFFLVSLGLLAIVVALVLKGLRRYFLTPLDSLIVGMRDFAGGNVEVRLRRTGSTELTFAIDTFNDMVYQIKNNRLRIYEEQLEKQKLLIQNLQAQIDPHFFSNTMNLIYNLIAMGETEASKKCLLHLSEYYRHITKISRQQILLEEEFAFIRAYLEIMSLRFPGKLDISVRLGDTLRGLRIPPLLVQPLVENCIQHGFVDRSRTFQLAVSAEPEGDCASIAVTDNGAGFPAEYCGTYGKNRAFPASEDTPDSHVGMWNIYQRLLTYYGADAELRIGREGALTRVEIRIRRCDQYC